MKRKGRDYDDDSSFYESIVGHKHKNARKIDEQWETIKNAIKKRLLNGWNRCTVECGISDHNKKRLRGFQIIHTKGIDDNHYYFNRMTISWPHNRTKCRCDCSGMAAYVERIPKWSVETHYKYPVMFKNIVFTCLCIFYRLNKTIDARISKDIKIMLIHHIAEDWRVGWVNQDDFLVNHFSVPISEFEYDQNYL